MFPEHSKTYLSTEPFLHSQEHMLTSQETPFSRDISSPQLESLQKGESNETPDVASGAIIFTVKNYTLWKVACKVKAMECLLCTFQKKSLDIDNDSNDDDG